MDRRNCSAGAVLEFHLRAHASDVRDRLTVAAAVAVTTGVAVSECFGHDIMYRLFIVPSLLHWWLYRILPDV